MKKLLLLIGAAFVALSGTAAMPQNLKVNGQIKTVQRSDVKAFGDFSASPERSVMKKSPAKAALSPADIITTVEGEKQEMIITGSGYYPYWGIGLAWFENEETASNIVYGDNDEVYIYNIIPLFPVNAYVKGVKKDDRIVVDLPQIVYWEDEAEEGYLVDLYQYEAETLPTGGVSWDYVPSDVSSLSLIVNEDGSMKADGLSMEGLVLAAGYCSDGAWAFYTTWDLSMTPFNEVEVSVPEDIEVSEDFWSMKCEELGYGWNFSFAQAGEEIYFQGMSPYMPDAWVKATVEYGDSEAYVSIAQDQYIGTYGGSYVYTKCVKIGVDEWGDEDFVFMPEDYQYQLVWDYEENTMVPKDPEVILLFNGSKNSVYYVDYFDEFVIMHQDSFDGVPMDPYDLLYVDFMEDYGELQFVFFAPGFTEDGDVLMIDDLSYVIYVNGDQWTFDAAEYGLEEDLTEIPWNLKSDYIGAYGSQHVVIFFVEGISSLGVQSVYKYDGKETRSEIVTIDLDPDAVGTVDAGKKVASVKYYGLDGREVTNPATGIFVKRVVFEDGSVATFKKAIR